MLKIPVIPHMVVDVLEVDIGMMLVVSGETGSFKRWYELFQALVRTVSSVGTSRFTPGDRKFHALKLLVSLFETFFRCRKTTG